MAENPEVFPPKHRTQDSTNNLQLQHGVLMDVYPYPDAHNIPYMDGMAYS